MSNQPAKVFIKVESSAEQQDHLKNSARKTLKILQKTATDKENLVGRALVGRGIYKSKADSETELTELAKRKKVHNQGSQTDRVLSADTPSPSTLKGITVADLTSQDAPGSHYWEILAEKRREALDETLVENQHLHQRIEGLEEELETSRQMLEEARSLVETLTDMLEETAPDEVNNGASTSLNSTGCSRKTENMVSDEETSDNDD